MQNAIETTFGRRDILKLAKASRILFLTGPGSSIRNGPGFAVWAASQPARANLIEPSVFRGFGTIVGAVFGALLAGLAARPGVGPALRVAGGAVWLAMGVVWVATG